MARIVNFADGAESETTPVIGNIVASALVQYPDDATYEATEQGAPAEGNIYFNTTDKVIRYYNGTAWITLVDESTAQELSNKDIDADQNTITNLEDENIKAGAAIDVTKLADGSVDNTEFQHLNGVTGNIQTQINSKLDASVVGQPNGVAQLDGAGLVPASQLPSFVDDVLEFADLASFPVTGESGKIYIALDTGNTYRWSGSAYVQISASGANQALSNLTNPTSVNQDLIPNADNARDLGSLILAWGQGFINALFFGHLYPGRLGDATNADAVAGVNLRSNNSNVPVTVETLGDSVANSNPTGSTYILTGNKTAGTGNSGNIHIKPGTSAGGQRGKIQLRDGSEGTPGHVWTSTGVNGEGAWQAPAPSSGVPAGTVISSFATATPSGYLYCDGSAVSRVTYADLFAAIGTSCGSGDGITTFNLPDTRGRFLRGQASGQTVDPDRASRTAMAAGGNTGDNVGSIQSDAFFSHTHTQDPHSHNIQGSSGASNSSVAGSFLCNVDSAGHTLLRTPIGTPYTYGVSTIVSTTATNQNTGGNETRPKNVYVRHYIKT